MTVRSCLKALLPLFLPLLVIVSEAGAASLEPWQLTTPLQVSRNAHGMVATPTHVYVLGGYSVSCTLLDSVEFAPIQADGSLGQWSFTTPLSFPRNFLGAVVVGDFLYVVGGADGCGLVEATKFAIVERAEIQSDGTLGQWNPVAFLNNPRAHMPVVTDGTYLYAVGGFDGGRTNTVVMTTVLPDGSLTPWQLVASMTSGREAAAVAIVNGILYAAGGLFSGVLNTTEGAVIQPDGTLAAWQPMAPLSVRRYQATGASVAGAFWVVGGTPNGVIFNTTEQAVFDASGAIIGWTADAPMIQGRLGHGMAVSDGLIYASGGDLTGQNPSVEFTGVGPVFRDGDNDGILDAAEACFCLNTPAGAVVNDQGCSIDQLCPCEAPLGRTAWRDHKEYVSCVRNAASEFSEEGGLTKAERREFVRQAERSACGR